MPLPLDISADRRRIDWRPILIGALVAFISALLVMVPVLIAVQKSNNRLARDLVDTQRTSSRTASVAACGRGNDISAYVLLRTRDDSLAQRLFRIRDCAATYDSERVILVSPEVEREYIKSLAEGGEPTIAHGKVVP